MTMDCALLALFLRIDMNDYSYEKGIAFIVEGATERVFYEEYLKKLCSERGMTITKDHLRVEQVDSGSH